MAILTPQKRKKKQYVITGRIDALNPSIKPELLKQAFQQLLTHHDALRLSFSQKNSNWEQTYSPAKNKIAFREIDLSKIPEGIDTYLVEWRRHSLESAEREIAWLEELIRIESK